MISPVTYPDNRNNVSTICLEVAIILSHHPLVIKGGNSSVGPPEKSREKRHVGRKTVAKWALNAQSTRRAAPDGDSPKLGYSGGLSVPGHGNVEQKQELMEGTKKPRILADYWDVRTHFTSFFGLPWLLRTNQAGIQSWRFASVADLLFDLVHFQISILSPFFPTWGVPGCSGGADNWVRLSYHLLGALWKVFIGYLQDHMVLQCLLSADISSTDNHCPSCKPLLGLFFVVFTVFTVPGHEIKTWQSLFTLDCQFWYSHDFAFRSRNGCCGRKPIRKILN